VPQQRKQAQGKKQKVTSMQIMTKLLKNLMVSYTNTICHQSYVSQSAM
jgi:hypothetical protein